jgi:hypothetical protein
MTRFDQKFNRVINYVWLALAVAALFAVFFKGAYHQLFTAVIAVIMFVVTRPRRRFHIPDQAYSDLNMQIEGAISLMFDERTKDAVFRTDEGDVDVALRVRIKAEENKTRFTDGAWGHVRTFTEFNYYCYVEILEVIVTDENGRVVDSDFDEDRIETEYETTEWK